MKNIFGRVLGSVLIVIAIAGMILCCVGILGVWRFRSTVEGEALAILALANETAKSAVSGLASTQTSLDAAAESISNLDVSLEAVGVTIDDSTHFFDTAAVLTSDTFPNTIRTTQKAIQAAAQSAKLVDDTLSVIASIPLIGSDYTPDQSLSDSLGEISTSLDKLPNTIEGLNDDVVQIKGNLVDLESHVEETRVQIERIKSSLSEANDVIVSINDTTKKLQPKLANFGEQIPRWFSYLAWGLTIFLVWFALAQLGLIVQGLSLILGKRFLEDQEKQ